MGIQADRRRQIKSEASSESEARRDLRAFDIYEIGRKASLDQHTISNAISDESVSVDDFRNAALKHVKKLVDDKRTSDLTDRFSLRQFILDQGKWKVCNLGAETGGYR